MFGGWVGQFFGEIYLHKCLKLLRKNYPKWRQHAPIGWKRSELEGVGDPVYSTLSSAWVHMFLNKGDIVTASINIKINTFNKNLRWFIHHLWCQLFCRIGRWQSSTDTFYDMKCSWLGYWWVPAVIATSLSTISWWPLLWGTVT